LYHSCTSIRGIVHLSKWYSSMLQLGVRVLLLFISPFYVLLSVICKHPHYYFLIYSLQCYVILLYLYSLVLIWMLFYALVYNVNFLDPTIHRTDKNLQFSIYWKPMQTDIIIPNSSCHLYKHKQSGINYVLNRLHIHPITKKRKKNIEENTIKNNLHNEYDINLGTPRKKQR
jgi:hypothetical protein